MLKLTPNTTEIFVLNEKFLLSERYAEDVNALAEYARGKEVDRIESLSQAVMTVIASLKYNYTLLKWYQLIKRYKLKKLTNQSYLIKHLSERNIYDLACRVLELEGVDTKKKVTTEKIPVPESQEELQTHF